jgi:TatD DNase family protein
VLVDTHCHLDFNSFDSDRQQVLERARQAGVEKILNPGINHDSSQKAVALADTTPEVFAAVGVHPNDALDWQKDTITALRTLATQGKVVAIGEIGLDYYRNRAPRELQRQVFSEQLSLAAELGLPVIIHNRDAMADLMQILIEWHESLVASSSHLAERPGVLHSYSEGESPARDAVALNFCVGFTGPVTFRNAPDLQRVAAALPVERLLVETDAPFLSPHPYRGKRNEPAMVRLVVEKIAELHHVPYESIASITTANASRLFQW